MYIPCQIVDLSSLESQATDSSDTPLGKFCCPCRIFRDHEKAHGGRHQRSDELRETEDPELLFSRHRAAVIAGHRFMTNWNLQNIAPPLPQSGPPPLPPRRLSSFFPPMEPMPPRKPSAISDHTNFIPPPRKYSSSSSQTQGSPGKRKDKNGEPHDAISPTVPPLPVLNGDVITSSSAQQPPPVPTTTNIACPYLSPIDVAATSWEWDFGKSDTLSSQIGGRLRSPSDQESGATDRVNIWGDPPVVKKGLLMQQREKIWSRWKERYVILTRDYLHCFRRLRNVYRFQITLSAMGQFIYKLRLANIEEIRWDTRRSVSRIALSIRHEPTILLRSSDDNVEALYHWYSVLQECICMSKIRRQAIRAFNTSSEEDASSASASALGNPSQFANAAAGAILNDDNRNDNDNHSHNSIYTIATSSVPSGASSSQTTDILEIYKRVARGAGGGTFLRSPAPRHTVLARVNNNDILSKANFTTTDALVHNRHQHHQPQPQKKRGSSTSQGFYLHDPPTPSIMAIRPHTQLMKRLQPVHMDLENDLEAGEIENILELPKRCTNPTREMETSSMSYASSAITEARLRHFRVSASPLVDEVEEEDNGSAEVEENEYDTTVPMPISSRCESRMTLTDFTKMPWRSSSACLSPPSPNTVAMREWRESNFETSSRLSAFPFPVPQRLLPVPQRSVSSFARPHQPPPHGVIGGRKVLPTPWTRNNPTLQIGKGAAFSRSNVIVCPSKLSADVTYLRRV